MDAAHVAGGVIVAARPVPVRVVSSRTAVVVVDMQNDFGSVGGMFEQAGIDISDIRATIPAIAELIDNARRSGMKIVFLKMAFRADLSDAGLPMKSRYRNPTVNGYRDLTVQTALSQTVTGLPHGWLRLSS